MGSRIKDFKSKWIRPEYAILLAVIIMVADWILKTT